MSEGICFAIVAAISAFLLRELVWKGVPVFISVAFISLISLAAPYLSQLGGFIKATAGECGVGDAAGAILKVLGIGYLTGITTDVCRELGSGMLASAVTLVGRIEIICVALPFFDEIVRIGGELLG